MIKSTLYGLVRKICGLYLWPWISHSTLISNYFSAEQASLGMTLSATATKPQKFFEVGFRRISSLLILSGGYALWSRIEFEIFKLVLNHLDVMWQCDIFVKHFKILNFTFNLIFRIQSWILLKTQNLIFDP